MRTPSLVAVLCLAGAFATCLATVGCAAPAAEAPGPPLPAYSADAMQMFDDGIDPHAVGLELEAFGNPRTDPRVRARAQASDVVLRARVTTITGEAGQGGRSYQITMKAIERLGGKHPLGDEFTVGVDKGSPSFGIVKSMEGQLAGKAFVVFLKAFARPDGQRELHFHASADEPDFIAAVKNAVLLDEMK